MQNVKKINFFASFGINSDFSWTNYDFQLSWLEINSLTYPYWALEIIGQPINNSLQASWLQ